MKSETWVWREDAVTLVYVVREDGSESYAVWNGSELTAMEDSQQAAVAAFVVEVRK